MISPRTIIAALAMVVALLLAFVLREVLIAVFVAAVLAVAIDPLVGFLVRRGVPRVAAIAIPFFGLLGLVTLVVATFVPLVLDQARQLGQAPPGIYGRITAFVSGAGNPQLAAIGQKALGALPQGAAQAAQGLFGRAVGFVEGAASVFGVLILTFYMAMDQKGMRTATVALVPWRERPRAERLDDRVKGRLGRWLRGQLLLGAVMGGLSYAALLLLHVQFALILALLAGLAELIPVVGPFIGAVPAVLVAASQQPILGLWVAIVYIVMQELEAHLLVPRIMSEATGLNPVVVIVAILAAAKLAGFVGVLLAVPAAILVKELLDEWLSARAACEKAEQGSAFSRTSGFG
ncbi:MAG TPA: AI-2E family transporter [Terriglobales bacterium]|nr:AI-2E family transporter [Terriglobales bacterium]